MWQQKTLNVIGVGASLLLAAGCAGGAASGEAAPSGGTSAPCNAFRVKDLTAVSGDPTVTAHADVVTPPDPATCTEVGIAVRLTAAGYEDGAPYKTSTGKQEIRVGDGNLQVKDASTNSCSDPNAACGGYQGITLKTTAGATGNASFKWQWEVDSTTYQGIPAIVPVTFTLFIEQDAAA